MTNINIKDLFKLPLEEKIKIVQDLWDNIASDAGVLPLSDEEREELDRRLDEYYKNPVAGSPWEEVKARLAKR